MPKLSDQNARIALAKGWTWNEGQCQWVSPIGERRACPDYVGTLEGVAGLMREMMDCSDDLYIWAPQMTCWICANHDWSQCWHSDLEHPGDCVGEAYLSMKEVADASTTD